MHRTNQHDRRSQVSPCRICSKLLAALVPADYDASSPGGELVLRVCPPTYSAGTTSSLAYTTAYMKKPMLFPMGVCDVA